MISHIVLLSRAAPRAASGRRPHSPTAIASVGTRALPPAASGHRRFGVAAHAASGLHRCSPRTPKQSDRGAAVPARAAHGALPAPPVHPAIVRRAACSAPDAHPLGAAPLPHPHWRFAGRQKLRSSARSEGSPRKVVQYLLPSARSSADG